MTYFKHFFQWYFRISNVSFLCGARFRFRNEKKNCLKNKCAISIKRQIPKQINENKQQTLFRGNIFSEIFLRFFQHQLTKSWQITRNANDVFTVTCGDIAGFQLFLFYMAEETRKDLLSDFQKFCCFILQEECQNVYLYALEVKMNIIICQYELLISEYVNKLTWMSNNELRFNY